MQTRARSYPPSFNPIAPATPPSGLTASIEDPRQHNTMAPFMSTVEDTAKDTVEVVHQEGIPPTEVTNEPFQIQADTREHTCPESSKVHGLSSSPAPSECTEPAVNMRGASLCPIDQPSPSLPCTQSSYRGHTDEIGDTANPYDEGTSLPTTETMSLAQHAEDTPVDGRTDPPTSKPSQTSIQPTNGNFASLVPGRLSVPQDNPINDGSINNQGQKPSLENPMTSWSEIESIKDNVWSIDKYIAFRLNDKSLEALVRWDTMTITPDEALEEFWHEARKDSTPEGLIQASWEDSWIEYSSIEGWESEERNEDTNAKDAQLRSIRRLWTKLKSAEDAHRRSLRRVRNAARPLTRHRNISEIPEWQTLARRFKGKLPNKRLNALEQAIEELCEKDQKLAQTQKAFYRLMAEYNEPYTREQMAAAEVILD